ncbi:hypothetical protein AYI68_g3489 [Smittium mucronatum]|uniref:Uncharacterized protein n=1 Tax=Smittium mucronatum TaxID=133383 RepID=A0A1R0GZR0_9FUNG|nr:hypothetical protein AYI68_g3489 [Smittium mucronatum]
MKLRYSLRSSSMASSASEAEQEQSVSVPASPSTKKTPSRASARKLALKKEPKIPVIDQKPPSQLDDESNKDFKAYKSDDVENSDSATNTARKNSKNSKTAEVMDTPNTVKRRGRPPRNTASGAASETPSIDTATTSTPPNTALSTKNALSTIKDTPTLKRARSGKSNDSLPPTPTTASRRSKRILSAVADSVESSSETIDVSKPIQSKKIELESSKTINLTVSKSEKEKNNVFIEAPQLSTTNSFKVEIPSAEITQIKHKKNSDNLSTTKSLPKSKKGQKTALTPDLHELKPPVFDLGSPEKKKNSSSVDSSFIAPLVSSNKINTLSSKITTNLAKTNSNPALDSNSQSQTVSSVFLAASSSNKNVQNQTSKKDTPKSSEVVGKNSKDIENPGDSTASISDSLKLDTPQSGSSSAPSSKSNKSKRRRSKGTPTQNNSSSIVNENLNDSSLKTNTFLSTPINGLQIASESVIPSLSFSNSDISPKNHQTTKSPNISSTQTNSIESPKLLTAMAGNKSSVKVESSLSEKPKSLTDLPLIAPTKPTLETGINKKKNLTPKSEPIIKSVSDFNITPKQTSELPGKYDITPNSNQRNDPKKKKTPKQESASKAKSTPISDSNSVSKLDTDIGRKQTPKSESNPKLTPISKPSSKPTSTPNSNQKVNSNNKKSSKQDPKPQDGSISKSNPTSTPTNNKESNPNNQQVYYEESASKPVLVSSSKKKSSVDKNQTPKQESILKSDSASKSTLISNSTLVPNANDDPNTKKTPNKDISSKADSKSVSAQKSNTTPSSKQSNNLNNSQKSKLVLTNSADSTPKSNSGNDTNNANGSSSSSKKKSKRASKSPNNLISSPVPKSDQKLEIESIISIKSDSKSSESSQKLALSSENVNVETPSPTNKISSKLGERFASEPASTIPPSQIKTPKSSKKKSNSQTLEISESKANFNFAHDSNSTLAKNSDSQNSPTTRIGSTAKSSAQSAAIIETVPKNISISNESSKSSVPGIETAHDALTDVIHSNVEVDVGSVSKKKKKRSKSKNNINPDSSESKIHETHYSNIKSSETIDQASKPNNSGNPLLEKTEHTDSNKKRKLNEVDGASFDENKGSSETNSKKRKKKSKKNNDSADNHNFLQSMSNLNAVSAPTKTSNIVSNVLNNNDSDDDAPEVVSAKPKIKSDHDISSVAAEKALMYIDNLNKENQIKSCKIKRKERRKKAKKEISKGSIELPIRIEAKIISSAPVLGKKTIFNQDSENINILKRDIDQLGQEIPNPYKKRKLKKNSTSESETILNGEIPAIQPISAEILNSVELDEGVRGEIKPKVPTSSLSKKSKTKDNNKPHLVSQKIVDGFEVVNLSKSSAFSGQESEIPGNHVLGVFSAGSVYSDLPTSSFKDSSLFSQRNERKKKTASSQNFPKVKL